MNSPENDPNCYFVCPHCGADVPNNAVFCRVCGASEDSGWNTDEDWEATESYEGYVDEEFDYDEFVQREFPSHMPKNNSGSWRYGASVAIIILICASYLLWMFIG